MSFDGDYMEMGSSGMVPAEDGWFVDKNTGNKVDPSGVVYDSEGQIIWSPELDDAMRIDSDLHDCE